MGRGKTIQIFLPDGSPNGIKLAEITSSIEKNGFFKGKSLDEVYRK